MLLEIRDLYVSYGHINALNGVSIDVEKGSIVAIIGANGAGKSTLVNTISGLVPRKQGTIHFNGKPLPSKMHEIVRAGITQVPEGRKIFPGLTVEENLVIGGFSRKVAETRKTQERMFEMFPILGERRRQQAGTLSGGEQQMLAIARGLMGNPTLLLLDEPSLGLAPIIIKQVFNLIEQVRGMGYTVMLIEQNATQAIKASDFTYLLENGVVKASGPSEELARQEDLMAAYLGESRQG